MPKDLSVETVKITAQEGKFVELPSGEFIANADMTRDGVDLHLTSPDGQHVVVEGYFNVNPHPDLISADGGRLSARLVDDFLPPQHVGQYAAADNGTMTDASPAGQISEVAGTATITRADGTKVTVTEGTVLYAGDVVETGEDGAVNIVFADNTTVAISESGRFALSQYNYNSETQTGDTTFSILKGVFVYTSGQIGKHNPENVNIETPVGSIGIRGTVVAGDIKPAGEESKITLVDGKIVITNAVGTIELNDNLETAGFSSFLEPPRDMGRIDVQSFNDYYKPVSGVADHTFNAVNTGDFKSANFPPVSNKVMDGAPDAPSADAPQDQPPPTEGDRQMFLSPDERTEGEQQAADEAPVDGSIPTPSQALLQAPIFFAPPESIKTEFESINKEGDFSTAPRDGFLAGKEDRSTAKSMDGSTSASLPPPDDGKNTGSPPDNGKNTGSPPDLQFFFSPFYFNGTLDTSDDGIPLFGKDLDTNQVLGRAAIQNFTGGRTYELKVFDIHTNTQLQHLTSSGNVMGKTYELDTSTTSNSNSYDTRVSALSADLYHFDAAKGTISLLNPLGATNINSNLGFQLIAKDKNGDFLDAHDFIFQLEPLTGTLLMGTSNSDGYTTSTPSGSRGIVLSADNTTVFAQGGSDRVDLGAYSHNDIRLGEGDDLAVIENQGFGFVSGGNGSDTVVFTENKVFDLRETPFFDAKLASIENIILTGSTADAGDLLMDLEGLFLMVGAGGTLHVSAEAGKIAHLFMDFDQLTLQSGTPINSSPPGGIGSAAGIGTGTVTYTGTTGAGTVTLVIDQGGSTDGVVISDI